jgi:hypothetical protein
LGFLAYYFSGKNEWVSEWVSEWVRVSEWVIVA